MTQSTQQRSKKKAIWKLPVFIGGGIAGVVVIAVVIVLVVSAGGNSSSSDDSTTRSAADDRTRSAIEEVFDRPPTQPDIIATGENWVPDKSLLDQLGPEVSVGEYSLRLPSGFEQVERPYYGYQSEWQRSKPTLDDHGYIGFAVNMATLREDTIRSKESQLVSMWKTVKQRQIERGRLNGIPCYRITYSEEKFISLKEGKWSVNSCSYEVLDGDRVPLLFFKCFSPPESEDYKLLETAARTLRRN